MQDTPPAYLFDLIKVSIHSQEQNQSALLAAIESALEKGAEGKEILKALFRGDVDEKFLTNDDRVEKAIHRLTMNKTQQNAGAMARVLPVILSLVIMSR